MSATVVLVCGGRAYEDREHVFAVLDALHDSASFGPFGLVVHGAAGKRDKKTGEVVAGADLWASEWAKARRVGVRPHPAAWKMHGKMAGPMRNTEMLESEQPDLVIAFPGGVGTADMVRKAHKKGVPVVEYAPKTREEDLT